MLYPLRFAPRAEQSHLRFYLKDPDFSVRKVVAHLPDDVVAVEVRQQEADAQRRAGPEDRQDAEQPTFADLVVKKVLKKSITN